MRKKLLATLALSAILTCAIGIWTHSVFTESSDGITPTQTAVETVRTLSYTVGDGTVFADITENGTTYRATYYVTPSKRVKAYAGGNVVLDEAGVYTVRYVGITDSSAVKDVMFTVNKKLYSIGNRSQAVYGTIDADYYRDRLAAKDTAALGDKAGLKLSLVSGDTFTYNRVLNLKDSTFNTPVLSMLCLPENRNAADAKRIRFKLTDLYDADNYIEMYLTWNDKTTAMENVTAVQVGFNGNMSHKSHWAPGTFIAFSMDIDEPSSHVATFDLLYDDETLALGCTPSPYNTGRDGALIPFSDPDITDKYTSYPEAWKGFTTGECILSIEGVGTTANALNMILFGIAGDDLSGENVFVDDTAPQFTVDYRDYSPDSLPHAAVGEPYTIFEAKAYDGSTVRTDVYLNLDSDSPISVPIANRCFTPPYEGLYTVVYRLTGKNGKTAVQYAEVYADAEEKFAFTVSGKAAFGKSGNETRVFNRVQERGTKRGNTEYTYTAVHKRSGREYAIDGERFTFIPMDAGAYEITVTGRDYVVTHTEKFILDVKAGDVPVIFDEAILPKYLIKDAMYRPYALKGYVFSSGTAIETTADVKAYFDGAKQPAQSDGGVLTVTANLQVKFVYSLTDGQNTTQKEYTVPVVDTGYGGILDPTAYFRAVTGTAAITDDGNAIRFTANQSDSEDGCVEIAFINPVQTYAFVTDFNTVRGETAFETLDIYLRDAVYSEKFLKITLFKNGNRTDIRVNDSTKSFAMEGNAFNPTATNLSIGFSAEKRAVIVNNRANGSNFTVAVSKFYDGQAFNGFTGNRAYLSYAFGGVTGTASLTLASINGQRFGGLEEDFNAPQYFVDVDNGVKPIGTVITLPQVDVIDVLDTFAEISLDVTDSDGNAVTSDGGVVLRAIDATKNAHAFRVVKTGDYTIRYTVRDGQVSRSYSYVVTVIDNIPPVLKIDGTPVKQAKAGDTIKLPKATVSEGAALHIYVSAPGASMAVDLAGNGKVYDGFTASVQGVYVIRYAASDGNGNFVTQTFTVSVQ